MTTLVKLKYQEIVDFNMPRDMAIADKFNAGIKEMFHGDNLSRTIHMHKFIRKLFFG